jgi:exonuclease III
MKNYLKTLFVFLPFLIYQPTRAQVTLADTFSVMSYNLTNYGNIFAGCTSTNNGLGLKNPELKNIIKHVMPDILGVCEMNTSPTVAGSFLNNVLNTDGITYYQRSNNQPEPAGTLTSVLFFNSLKFGLKQQSYANTPVRLVHHFRLYLKTEGLASGDTLWLNVLAGHLKAGNTAADRTDRGTMATAVRNYLNGFSKKENCLIMGDFNLYNSSEAAWQTLTAANPNRTYQFIDPINRVGSWSVNSTFSDVHTQCPSLNSNGCFSGGGLDDRFDFILMNRHLLNDSAGLKYIPGTYKALGNDGLHYNKNITDNPTNNSAPQSVLVSLFKASDHLPVLAKISLNQIFTPASKLVSSKLELNHELINNRLILSNLPENQKLEICISDFLGRQVSNGVFETRDGTLEIALPGEAVPLLVSGTLADGRIFTFKLLRNL